MNGDSHVTESLCAERRERLSLSSEQIDEIAEKAANKAMQKITGALYEEVGRAFFNKLILILGIIAVAGTLWAQSKGWLN